MLRSHPRGMMVSHTINICSASPLHFFLLVCLHLYLINIFWNAQLLDTSTPITRDQVFAERYASITCSFTNIEGHWTFTILLEMLDITGTSFDRWQTLTSLHITNAVLFQTTQNLQNHCMLFNRHWKSLNIHNYPWDVRHYSFDRWQTLTSLHIMQFCSRPLQTFAEHGRGVYTSIACSFNSIESHWTFIIILEVLDITGLDRTRQVDGVSLIGRWQTLKIEKWINTCCMQTPIILSLQTTPENSLNPF